MTKKDYVLIAGVLNDAYRYRPNDIATVLDVMGRLIPALGADNPRFDADRFRTAVTKEA